jgi:hypothetical protein
MITRPILFAFCVTAASFVSAGAAACEASEIVKPNFEQAIPNLRANRWSLQKFSTRRSLIRYLTCTKNPLSFARR